MRHCDGEMLALRALGEPAGTSAEIAHLAACAYCRSELERLRSVVARGRAITPADRLAPPPDAVWGRIAGDLGLAADAGGPARSAPSAPRLAPSVPGDQAGTAPSPEPVAPSTMPARGTAGDPAGARRARLRWRPAIGAVAAGLVGVAVGAGLAVVALDGSDGRAASVVARAVLEPVGDLAGSGTARVEDTGRGRRLVVEATGLPTASGYHEVWLMDARAGRLVSLGVLPGSAGSYPLPSDLALQNYPLVDISREPLDGDPAHSGDSLLRGVIIG